jgi:hypothetical protein
LDDCCSNCSPPVHQNVIYNTAAILESIGLQEKSTAQPQHQSAAAWSQFIEFPWKEKIARKRYSIPKAATAFSNTRISSQMDARSAVDIFFSVWYSVEPFACRLEFIHRSARKYVCIIHVRIYVHSQPRRIDCRLRVFMYGYKVSHRPAGRFLFKFCQSALSFRSLFLSFCILHAERRRPRATLRMHHTRFRNGHPSDTRFSSQPLNFRQVRNI